MDMWIECLLLKHEDLNSDLHDICNKTDVSEQCCNDILERQRQEDLGGLLDNQLRAMGDLPVS